MFQLNAFKYYKILIINNLKLFIERLGMQEPLTFNELGAFLAIYCLKTGGLLVDHTKKLGGLFTTNLSVRLRTCFIISENY
jgi:hypothetical protein